MAPPKQRMVLAPLALLDSKVQAYTAVFFSVYIAPPSTLAEL